MSNDPKNPKANAPSNTKASESKDAKKKARSDARKAARKVLASWVADAKQFATIPAALQEPLKVWFGRTAGGFAATGNSMNDRLVAFFEKNPKVDELELFKQFKIGRGEMRKKVRALIRDNDPASRLWIAFDEATETWNLKGKGEKAPAGWKGYLPTEGGDAKDAK